MLAAGADIEAKDRNGNTPLLVAATEGYQDVAGKAVALIDAGVDIAARDEDGYTALHLAAAWGTAKMVARLLDADAGHSLSTADWREIANLASNNDKLSKTEVYRKLREVR